MPTGCCKLPSRSPNCGWLRRHLLRSFPGTPSAMRSSPPLARAGRINSWNMGPHARVWSMHRPPCSPMTPRTPETVVGRITRQRRQFSLCAVRRSSSRQIPDQLRRWRATPSCAQLPHGSSTPRKAAGDEPLSRFVDRSAALISRDGTQPSDPTRISVPVLSHREAMRCAVRRWSTRRS